MGEQRSIYVDEPLSAQDKAGSDSSLGAHPEARMSAAEPGLAWGHDPDAVTLREVMNDPVDGIKRMGAAIQRDVSDPKLWLGIALNYLGPRAFGTVAPMIAKAAAATARGAVRGTAAVGDVISPDLIGIASPRIGKAVEAAQRVRGAMATPAVSEAPAAEPVVSAPAVRARRGAAKTPASQTPPSAGSTPTPPSSSPVSDEPVIRMGPDGLLVGRPGGNPNMPDQKALNEAAIAQRRSGQAAPSAPPAQTPAEPPAAAHVKLTAAETTAFLQLLKRGMSGPDAMKNILMQRELVGQLGTPAPTAKQTRFPKGMRGKVGSASD